jgi:hypothetical protein
MGEGSGQDAKTLGDITDLAELANTDVVGNSPLANALRRRRTEIDRAVPVVAGHDSVI